MVAAHIQQSDDANTQALKPLGIRAYACNPCWPATGCSERCRSPAGSRTSSTEEVAFIETICHYVTVACERLRLLNELKESGRARTSSWRCWPTNCAIRSLPSAVPCRCFISRDPPCRTPGWSRAVIDRQVQHLTRLVDDLLDISRITRNKLVLRRSPIELAEVITGAVESSRPLIEQCGHELTLSLAPEPVYVDGDAVRLSQVFQNLLNNAAKYTERGGRISLTAERQGTMPLSCA
jgi:signal transduction histidine kinase